MQYKINQLIIVRYLAIDNEEGLADLTLTPTNPSGVDQTPIVFTEIGDGLYTVNFTPDTIGWWLVRVSSLTKPKNIYSKSYFVGTEYTTYPPQEDGKLTSIDTKLGEVQASPTTNTVLARLKDIYDKLVDGITATIDKVKIWNGTNIADVTADGKLKVETYQGIGTSQLVIIKDGAGNNYLARVDESGRLLVSTQPPSVPPTNTSVIRTVYSNMSTTVDDDYKIPNGQTLIILRLSSSSEVDIVSGNVVELWYDLNGNGIGMQIIDVIHTSGSSTQHDLYSTFIGDSVNKIKMRRKRLGGGAKWIFGRWEGYY